MSSPTMMRLCTPSVHKRAAALVLPWAFAQTRLLWQGLDQSNAAKAQEETRLAWQQADPSKPSDGSTEPGSSAQSSTSPLLNDIARVLEGRMGLKLGRSCMVGEGLATVDLGLFVEGRMVAVHLEPLAHAAAGSSSDSRASPLPSAREYAEARTRQRVLQSFGWATATVLEQDWVTAGQDDHKKMHLLLTAVKTALGKEDGDNHHHHHHSGCGCSH